MDQSPIPALTGTHHNDNYVWAIAMNLAWNEMLQRHLGGSVEIPPGDPVADELVRRFNSGQFHEGLLEAAAYFVRSGFGQAAVQSAIADLQREKGVDKSMLNELTLLPNDLFSYARVEKKLKWKANFKRCVGQFGAQKVAAFQPDKKATRGIRIMEYTPDMSTTTVRLLTDDEQDEVYLMSGYTPGREAEMVAKVSAGHWPRELRYSRSDTLIIPEIKLNVNREYAELLGKPLLSPAIDNIFLSKMNETIDFSMSYRGVEFLAEAVMIRARGMPPPPKTIIFDKPFLIVLKQMNQSLPYLVIGISDLLFLHDIRTNFRLGRPLTDRW